MKEYFSEENESSPAPADLILSAPTCTETCWNLILNEAKRTYHTPLFHIADEKLNNFLCSLSSCSLYVVVGFVVVVVVCCCVLVVVAVTRTVVLRRKML